VSLSLRTAYNTCKISGFRLVVDENCAVLGYYAASRGNILETFRDNTSVPHQRQMKDQKGLLGWGW